jgi:YgiT-type zinc finger domain-containing protein
MICDNCGREGARVRRVNETYGKKQDLLVIEDVPIISCPNCGESYLTAETLYEIERIRLNRKSISVKRPVAVAHFSLKGGD